MTTLSELIQNNAGASALAAHLDALSESERQQQALALSRGRQAKLFEQVEGALPFTLDDLVPTPAKMNGVAHEGINSLPAFRRFAKVFCHPAERNDELWGYNRTSDFITNTVGPGYFVTVPHGRDELLVDYNLTPPGKPSDWPPILHKYERFSRFVYFGTQDVLRRVSKHVSIGRARRAGSWMDNWFVLCRS